MGKIFKTVSTIMIAVGLAFLYTYAQGQGSNRLNILQQPSYYVVQSYWFIFVAGIIVLLFSLLGSFFSWFREFEAKEEILPNAGYVSDQEIRTWVDGSDTGITEVLRTETAAETETSGSQATEVLGLQPTEVLEASELSEKTDIIGRGR